MTRKTPAEWFAEYEVCHRNATNEVIHWVCVPIIAGSLIGLLWDVPFPQQPLAWMNWSLIVMLCALCFYAKLSLRLATGMAVCFTTATAVILAYRAFCDVPLWIPSLTLFVVAWIGQFIGHRIEGKKPAFFQDLQFLLIGPAWVLNALYQRLGF